MIKAKVKNGTTEIEISGKLGDITSDVCAIARSAWLSISKSDEKAGKHFEEMFTEILNDGMIFITDEELDERMAEIKKSKKIKDKAEELSEKADNLANDIEKMLNDIKKKLLEEDDE